MDAKPTPLNFLSTIPGNYVITLDILQYFFYQSEQIDIHAPDGTHLQTIGYGIKKSDVENKIYSLKEHIYAVEFLLGKLNNSLELPAQAVSALADLLCGMQGFCRKYIK